MVVFHVHESNAKDEVIIMQHKVYHCAMNKVYSWVTNLSHWTTERCKIQRQWKINVSIHLPQRKPHLWLTNDIACSSAKSAQFQWNITLGNIEWMKVASIPSTLRTYLLKTLEMKSKNGRRREDQDLLASICVHYFPFT